MVVEQVERGVLDAPQWFADGTILAEQVGSDVCGQTVPNVRVGDAYDHRCRHVELRSEIGHASHDLAFEALTVEMSFARDHEVGAVDRVCEVQFIGDQLETSDDLAAQCCEAAGKTTGCSGPAQG